LLSILRVATHSDVLDLDRNDVHERIRDIRKLKVICLLDLCGYFLDGSLEDF